MNFFKVKLFRVIGIVVLLLGIQFALKAQKAIVKLGNGQIIGTVIDADTKSPLEYTTLILYKKGSAKVINATTTDNQGQFRIKDLDTAVYSLHVEYIACKTVIIDDILIDLARLKINLNKIAIKKTAVQLESVTVTSSTKLIENKIDKMVFNAEKDISSQGGVATDLLKKIPMVSVDIDGNVQLAGTSSIRFLINGKPSVAFGSNITDVLQSIPASQIKLIEVITNPGAKYDADGLGGIINIILKQNNTRGYNGTINTSMGTRIENGSINLAARRNNFGVNFFLATNQTLSAPSPKTMNRITIDSLNRTTHFMSQDGSTDVTRHGTHSGLNMDWTYLKKNNFTASYSNNSFGFNSSGDNTQILTSQPFIGTLIQDGVLYNKVANFNLTKGGEISASYKRTFDKPDRELEISFNSGSEKSNIKSSALQYKLPARNLIFGNDNQNYAAEKQTEIKVDFSEPISNDLKWNSGSKFSSVDINSSTDVLTQSANTPLTRNNSLSNYLTYGQKVMAIYTELEFPIKNIVEVKIGGRYEQTSINGFYSTANQKINPSYNNFVPSIFFKRNIGDDNSIKFSYSQRISRPGYEELNPYTNITDPRNMSTGNPFLLPQNGERMELTYNHSLKGIGSLMIAFFQRNSDKDIQPFVTYYSSLKVGDSTYNNVNLSRSENIGLEKNTGINIFGDFQFVKGLNITTNLFYYYRRIYNSINPNFNAKSPNYKINLNVKYEFTKTLVAEFFGNFSSARNEVQGKYPSYTSYSMAVRKKFWNTKGSLGLVANNPFANFIKQQTLISGPNFYSDFIRYVPSRSFGISFNWRFGKLEFKKEKNSAGGLEDTPVN